jgi:para-nitrobenzyl esterase
MDTVKTENGYVSGKIRGEPGKEVYTYWEIPYAAPPVGDLRWRPPQPAASWSGIRECTAYTNQPAQYYNADATDEGLGIPFQEDCLYLNVLTPTKKATDKLPVMVWLHGGGLSSGSGNWPVYTGPRLPQHGVVLVTVNTRLTVLGLLAHPLLSKESSNGVSGNYMYLDMIAALKWVQKNIAAFGGDPNNITIFGESGGGWKVTGLMSSPLARGLFHRAIIESGAGLVGMPLKKLEAVGKELFTKLGVDKEKNPLAAARAIPWEKIIEDYRTIGDNASPMSSSETAAIDGWFLMDKPADIFKEGKQNAVPMILGSNLGELPTHGVRMKHIEYYAHLLIENRRLGIKGYAFVFDQVPSKWRQQGCVACHTMEMPYVFGTWDKPSSWAMVYGIASRDTGVTITPEPGITDVDKKVSEETMTMWAQFAKMGAPSVEGIVDWPAYEKNTDQYLYITEPLQVKSGFSEIIQKMLQK